MLDDGFLLSVFELNTMLTDQFDYSSVHLYEVILNRFNDLRVEHPTDVPYIQPQLSGTCVFSGLHAYLRLKLPNDERPFSKLYFFLGKEMLSFFTTHCPADSFLKVDLVEDAPAANWNYLRPAFLHGLLIQFVRYISWLGLYLQGTHSAYFVEKQFENVGFFDALNLVKKPHYNLSTTDNVIDNWGYLRPVFPHEQLIQFDKVNESLDLTKENELIDFANQFSLSLHEIRNQLSTKFDIGFNITSDIDMLPISKPRRFNVSYVEPLDVDTIPSTITYCQLPRFPSPSSQMTLVPLASISLLSESSVMHSCFGHSAAAQASYISQYILYLPLEIEMYEKGQDQAITEQLNSVFDRLLHLLAVTPVHAPHFDYNVALYKLYYLYWKFACRIDESSARKGKLANLPLSAYPLIGLKENMRVLAYSSYAANQLDALLEKVGSRVVENELTYIMGKDC